MINNKNVQSPPPKDDNPMVDLIRGGYECNKCGTRSASKLDECPFCKMVEERNKEKK